MFFSECKILIIGKAIFFTCFQLDKENISDDLNKSVVFTLMLLGHPLSNHI